MFKSFLVTENGRCCCNGSPLSAHGKERERTTMLSDMQDQGLVSSHDGDIFSVKYGPCWLTGTWLERRIVKDKLR